RSRGELATACTGRHGSSGRASREGAGIMEQVHVLRIVVASPGDVQAERDALPAVLDELNRGIAAAHGLRLELGRWETDAYPGFHPPGPQGLIEPIMSIGDCDVLLQS